MSVDIPSHMRSIGYDEGVNAERERAKALIDKFDAEPEFVIDDMVVLHDAIRNGLTVEELEAKWRGES